MKIALIIITVLVVAVAGLHFTAEKTFKFERSIVVNKPKDYVFSQIKMVSSHLAWNPWAKEDQNIKISTTGEDGTVGFISKWEGNSDVGAGEEEIKSIVEGDRIITELRFKKPMEATNIAFLAVETVTPGQTKVTWNMSGENKFPGTVICRILNMQKKMEADFDKGLTELKTILEKN